jgi:hypothetical protein
VPSELPSSSSSLKGSLLPTSTASFSLDVTSPWDIHSTLSTFNFSPVVTSSNSFDLLSNSIATSEAYSSGNQKCDIPYTAEPFDSFLQISAPLVNPPFVNGHENNFFIQELAPVQSLLLHQATPDIVSDAATPKTDSFVTDTSSIEATTPRSKPGRKRALKIETDDQVEKRRRNNAAAAKYRQKKVDCITELEKSLDDVISERDALKLELARKNAEVDILSRLLAEKDSRGSG